MKNTNRQPSSGSVLLGMAAGAALGAVGTMAMAQNQRQVKRTARKLAKGAERAMSQLDTMVTDLVERLGIAAIKAAFSPVQCILAVVIGALVLWLGRLMPKSEKDAQN